ncbi:hypothetical protein ACQ3I4_09225 [Zafaria sp. Z1313]|uniref:hypothetical protein n=1 Tax=Zafaria sp. Z1313 TaxID=3423202 RepID=UPI003D302D73
MAPTSAEENLITGADEHEHLAAGFPVGERFHSAPVVRLADAKPVELGHQALADGRWRIYAFADAAHPTASGSRLAAFCRFLAEDQASPVLAHTPAGADLDAVFDVRAVFQQGHRELETGDLPGLLLPRKAPFGLVDYEKAFTAGRVDGPDVFEARGIDRERGAVVVVRPDQYVAHVLPLDAHAELSAFFARFLRAAVTA